MLRVHQLDLELRMAADQLTQSRCQIEAAETFHGRHPHHAGELARGIGGIMRDFASEVFHLRSDRQDTLSLGRQQQTSSAFDEERNSRRMLQGRQPPAHGRHIEAQGFCCGSDRPGARNVQEGVQIAPLKFI